MDYGKSYALMQFDDLDLIAVGGWRIRCGFEGVATVSTDGEIVSIQVRAYKGGRQDMLPIHPEDGQLYADLIAALKDQYASSIEEAAESAQRQALIRPSYEYAD